MRIRMMPTKAELADMATLIPLVAGLGIMAVLSAYSDENGWYLVAALLVGILFLLYLRFFAWGRLVMRGRHPRPLDP